jgi:DNA repair exonuclease SbcCD nuclease subunit
MTYPFKKVLIVGDIHYGAHANSLDWLTEVENMFDNFLEPLIKKEQPDCLFFLGDIFENRQSLHIPTMHLAYNRFKKLSQIVDNIHIIAGNHDVFYKTRNDISSLSVLEHIPRLKIWFEPEIVKWSNKNVFLMPWRANEEIEKETISKIIKSNSINYIMCHATFKNAKLSQFSSIETGVELDPDFPQIISGHIHYHQQFSNLLYTGTPYQITRSDAYNKKGAYLLDIESSTLTFHENKTSAQFLTLNWSNIKNCKLKSILDEIKGNRVDLVVNYADSSNKKLLKFIEDARNITKSLTLLPEKSTVDNFDISQIKSLHDPRKILFDYIDNLDYDNSIIENLKNKVKHIYENLKN